MNANGSSNQLFQVSNTFSYGHKFPTVMQCTLHGYTEGLSSFMRYALFLNTHFTQTFHFDPHLSASSNNAIGAAETQTPYSPRHVSRAFSGCN